LGQTWDKEEELEEEVSKEDTSNACAREFVVWYASYPHKIGRGAAEKSFQKARAKASPQELMDGLMRYIRTKPPDRAYCNPATWLNQERWNDEPSEPIYEEKSYGKPTRTAELPKSSIQRAIEATERARAAREQRSSG